MKTNNFRVKEKKEKKIIIEEERTENPFILFLKNHKNFIITALILLGISSLLVTVGLAFSLFQTSTEFDISFLDDTTEQVIAHRSRLIDAKLLNFFPAIKSFPKISITFPIESKLKTHLNSLFKA